MICLFFMNWESWLNYTNWERNLECILAAKRQSEKDRNPERHTFKLSHTTITLFGTSLNERIFSWNVEMTTFGNLDVAKHWFELILIGSFMEVWGTHKTSVTWNQKKRAEYYLGKKSIQWYWTFWFIVIVISICATMTQ